MCFIEFSNPSKLQYLEYIMIIVLLFMHQNYYQMYIQSYIIFMDTLFYF